MQSKSGCTLIGHVGRDAELRFTPQGTPVCEFSLATNDRSNGGSNGNTQWHNCSLFGKRAEKIVQYITKGIGLVVEGRFKVRPYKTKDGSMAFSIDVTVDDVTIVGGGEERQSTNAV